MSIIENNFEKNFNFFFCDTTLRDGEQVTGVNYTVEQKLKIATLLDKLGVESIDAGFAATSPEERKAIKAISDAGLNLRTMSMCRVVKKDIDYAISCNVDGVILFIPGSDIHIKAKFGSDIEKQRNILIQNSLDCIKYAKDKGLKVEFGVEDSTRTEFNVLLEILSKAEEAGADWLGTTDTVGFFTPEKIYEFIKKLVENLNKPVGIHCHNDFGLATANTVAGLCAGAGYASPTVNGIGERAGNAALEEVIMILKVLYNQDLKYDCKILSELSEMVENYSKVKLDILKPIVGKNAYSHESGIHVDGMLKDTNTYEVFNPEQVGRKREYVLGKHSGKSMIHYVLVRNGLNVDKEVVTDFWHHMKANEVIGTRYTEDYILDNFIKYRKNKNNENN